MVIFRKTQPDIEISSIIEIEKIVELIFPNDYKNHLLHYNGGKCNPNIFDFIENNQKTSSSINYFLAVSKEIYGSLNSYIDTYKTEEKRLPRQIIPIAYDEGGNLICISCGEEDYGYIYFWNHEREVDYSKQDDSNYDNLYLISNSFTDFLDGLYEETDE